MRHRLIAAGLAAGLAALVASCGERPNPPINAPLDSATNALPLAGTVPDDIYVGLAFSGGGHRASAFSFGVLEELAATGRDAGNPDGLAGKVRFLTAVSGGSVTATWFALRGPGGLRDFRARYLLADGERYMAGRPLTPGALARGIGRGLNARDSFARALDESLFSGATFGDLGRQSRVLLSIVASDIANAAPFVFNADTFDALCSDLSRLPLSEAVAASAALPIVFSPIRIEAQPRSCAYRESPVLAAARQNPQGHPALRLYAETQARYADPDATRSVSLLDGGATDILGTTGFLAARARDATPYGPMTPQEAIRLRHILFVAVDGSIERTAMVDKLGPAVRVLGLSIYGLSQRLRAEGGGKLDALLSQRAISATTRDGTRTLRGALTQWRQDIIRWRCGLDAATVAHLLGQRSEGWNCRELAVFLAEVTPADLPPALRRAFNEVPTRLTLPPQSVDLATEAGRQALRRDPIFRAFLRNVRG
jgi:NTE family protein